MKIFNVFCIITCLINTIMWIIIFTGVMLGYHTAPWIGPLCAMTGWGVAFLQSLKCELKID